MFVGLPGNIDGLVHLSDLSWTESGEEAVRKYKKGEEVETVVLAIDVEKERISLGIKQLEGDPFNNFLSVNDKGALVKGTVKSLKPKAQWLPWQTKWKPTCLHLNLLLTVWKT